MKPEILENYRKAGKIAKKAREFGATIIKPEASILNIVDKVESKIKDLGAELAFPLNLSVNEWAAHDTADLQDERKLKEGQLVKLDIGTCINGFIGDTATTINLGGRRNEKLLEAAEQALNKALAIMKPGINADEVSQAIEKEIRNRGFAPVVNLTGHLLGKHDLHAGVELPNVAGRTSYKLKEDDVFAIEPFATSGVGKVIESDKKLIYKFRQWKPSRFRESRKILKFAKDRKLPFAIRWLKVDRYKLQIILRQLESNKALKDFPALREKSREPVAQAEHTVIVGEEPEVTTR